MIAATFFALVILSLAVVAGALAYAALCASLTAVDVSDAAEYQLLCTRLLAPSKRPFVLRRAPAEYSLTHSDLDAPISLPRIETAAEVLEARTEAVQASAARVHGRPVIQALKMTGAGEWTLTFVPAC